MADEHIGDVLLEAIEQFVAASQKALEQSQDARALTYAQTAKEFAQALQALGLRSN